ncbi:hypothetical protein ACQ9BO_08700 [Flavobacterium sp. P21]|uniref:hypothetical protein n=1 Tax=Flavobacterium sp. P21 TaxID=3423948 RepID=UPI003D67AFF1
MHYINGYLIVGNIDGGYLGLNEKTGFIYIMYVDQLDSINTIFVENEVQFFEVLLIFAEYSTNGSEEEIENYVERCENICPSGNFDLFF